MAWVGSKVRRISDSQEGVITNIEDQSIVLKVQIDLKNGEKCTAYRCAFCIGNPEWQVKFAGVDNWVYLDD